MNSHEAFIHIHQGCFAGTGAIVRLPQCQWSKPDGYGKISQCITTTKHSKAKTVCIFLGIFRILPRHILCLTCPYEKKCVPGCVDPLSSKRSWYSHTTVLRLSIKICLNQKKCPDIYYFYHLFLNAHIRRHRLEYFYQYGIAYETFVIDDF